MIITDVIRRGEHGFAWHRIPAIVSLDCGTLICAYECRETLNDWDTRAIETAVSEDGGLSWGYYRQPAYSGNLAVNNPTLIAEGKRLRLVYAIDYYDVFTIYSDDKGKTFSKPERIDAADDLKELWQYNVIAPGPGHGIVSAGRIIVPVWMANGEGTPGAPRPHAPSVVSALYCENGKWYPAREYIKGCLKDPNETAAAALPDGRIIFNLRNVSPERRRGYVYEKDGRFTEPRFDYELVDPVCFGSACRRGDDIYFVNCYSEKERRQLCIIRLSSDGLGTKSRKIIYDKAGYADIAINPDGSVCVFFERDDFTALSCIRIEKEELNI